MAKLMFVKNVDINEFRGIRRLLKPLELQISQYLLVEIMLGRQVFWKPSIY